MAARNRRKNNKKKSLLVTSAAQEKNATYVLVAEELHKNTIDLNMGTETPLTENHENPIPAKEFKHQQKLEPIDEHDDGEDELSIKFKSMTKSSGPITEAEVQKLLLSYAFTSAAIQEDENEKESRHYPIKPPSPSASSLSAYFQSFVEKCKQVFYNFSLQTVEKLNALQNSLYEVFWIIFIYLNYRFPNVGDYVSNTFGQQDSIIIRISLSKRHFRALREKSSQKVQQALKNIYFCFQEKPYLTAFKVSFAIGLAIPCSLLFLIMVSTATFFFFVYLTLFVVIGFFSSLFIIPLLGISFVFAIGVVSFGFCSNMSFKMAQLIYVRADAFLKKVLDKIALQTQPAQLQEPQEPLSTLRPVSNPTIPSPLRQTARPSKFVTEEDVIFEPVSAQSAIARSLETTANKAGNKFQLS
ncbi:Outer spore wall protein 5 [Saccharomyces cerevisiae]